MEPVTKKEYDIIEFQLGRKPDNLLGIACYCPYHRPAVIVTEPYKKGKIFPTLYWLSCPDLVKKVSRIEDTGLIKELTSRMKNDVDFARKMEKAHDDYARRRLTYLDIDLEKLPTDIENVIKNSGVGGIRNKEGIKCLHAHLADYMVNQNNPAGKLIYEMIEWPVNCDYCPENNRKTEGI